VALKSHDAPATSAARRGAPSSSVAASTTRAARTVLAGEAPGASQLLPGAGAEDGNAGTVGAPAASGASGPEGAKRAPVRTGAQVAVSSVDEGAAAAGASGGWLSKKWTATARRG